MEVLFIFRLSKKMSSTKIYYKLPEGFHIKNILQNKISEEDRIIFEEITNASLRKILHYCYGYTSNYCWGQDDCYHCTIILFINDEKIKRMGSFPPCEILDRGTKSCNFSSCTHCRTKWTIHYKL